MSRSTAGSVLDHVLVVASIARDHRGPVIIVDAVSVGRLDGVAVIDLECSNLYPITLIDDTVPVEFFNRGLYALQWWLLVFDPDFDISRIGIPKRGHEPLRPHRSDDAQRRRAP